MGMGAWRERLAEDLGLWLIDGLISKETYDLLRQRYDGRRLGLARAIRFCGIGGGMLAFFGLLGLAGAAVGSALFGAMLLLAVGAGLTTWGIRLSLDPLGRNTMSADVLLVLGMVSGIGGVAVACQAFGWQDTRLLRITGTLTLPILFVLAYRYRNIFLLILGLMGLFHWVGTWTAMFGQSTYEISIQDPRLMSVAALVAVGLGIYHELRLTERTGRFYQAYEALGLVYLNLSLLIMTIFPKWGPPPVWMVVLTAASIGQIVLGARLHNGSFTGFGVTAFAVNLYTRYFELCWENTPLGIFFIAGGLSLFAAGLGCEMLLKRLRSKPA